MPEATGERVRGSQALGLHLAVLGSHLLALGLLLAVLGLRLAVLGSHLLALGPPMLPLTLQRDDRERAPGRAAPRN